MLSFFPLFLSLFAQTLCLCCFLCKLAPFCLTTRHSVSICSSEIILAQRWTRREIALLIPLLRYHEPLWNRDHINYENAEIRDGIFEDMMRYFGNHTNWELRVKIAFLIQSVEFHGPEIYAIIRNRRPQWRFWRELNILLVVPVSELFI